MHRERGSRTLKLNQRRRELLKALGLAGLGFGLGMLVERAIAHPQIERYYLHKYSGVQPYSYEIFGEGDTYYAKSGKTGEIKFEDDDASEVIQSAVNELPNGGEIAIKSGVFLISKEILLSANITIFGEGSSTILKTTKYVNIFRIPDGAIRITIAHLQLDGNRDNIVDEGDRHAHNGILTRKGASEIVIYNLWIHDFHSAGLHLDALDKSIIYGNHIWNLTYDGMHLGTDELSFRDNIVANNYLKGLLENNGIHTASESERNIFLGNHVENFGGGIVVLGNYNIIASNTCIHNDFSGISISGNYNIVIGNDCSDPITPPIQNYGIRLDSPADYNYVIYNNVTGGTVGGIYIHDMLNNVVKFNIGFATENSGVVAFSGDGSTSDFEIGTHGLAITDPEKIVVKITPISSDAITASPCIGYVDPADNTKIRVKFASAPASGADNVKIKWSAWVE